MVEIISEGVDACFKSIVLQYYFHPDLIFGRFMPARVLGRQILCDRSFDGRVYMTIIKMWGDEIW